MINIASEKKINETEIMKGQPDSRNIKDVINYYNTCWLNRFSEGHNPKSYAMHFGIFKDTAIDNDSAKLETNHLLIDALGIPADKNISIADFGCGIGGTCIYLGERFPLISVYGINVSPEQINFAKQVSGTRELKGKVEYLLCDYCDTLLSSSSMDYVIAVESIWHAENKANVFNEASRVLKDNGSFAFIDYFQTRETATDEETTLLTEFNNGWGAYEAGTGPIKTFTEDYEIEMKTAGFGSVRSESLLNYVYKGILNSFEKAQIKLNTEILSEDLIKHYKACVALKILVDKGVIDYKIVTAQK